jgi:hypothetical protein
MCKRLINKVLERPEKLAAKIDAGAVNFGAISFVSYQRMLAEENDRNRGGR